MITRSESATWSLEDVKIAAGQLSGANDASFAFTQTSSVFPHSLLTLACPKPDATWRTRNFELSTEQIESL